LIERGGWVMYPLLICSITALALTCERTLALRRRQVIPAVFVQSVSQLLKNRQYHDIAFLCQGGETAAARLVRLALKMNGTLPDAFKNAMQEAGRRESMALVRYLGALHLVASVAPLLGLLGTVSGMISAFNAIAMVGAGHSGLLAGGISEALLTTATGLCVAIPALVIHRGLISRAETLSRELEDLGTDLMEALALPLDKA
ncbi:MAG: MotA/TolQ/ExbB proton channel family protein, partial [Candidatus Adiutrix sp.]